MKYLPNHPYFKYTNKEMTEFVTRKDKCLLTINGKILDTSYLSLLSCIYDNLTESWDTKDFFNGSMTKQEYIKHMEKDYGTELKGSLCIICNGEILFNETI